MRIALAVVLLLSAAATTLAQNAANQVTRVQLESRGTTQIGGLAPRGNIAGILTLRMRNHPDPDAGSQAGAEAQLPIPQPRPKGVVGTAGKNAFGFDGMNSIDSALVNEGLAGEPPDQGLCVANGFVTEAINSAVAVYDPLSGALLAGPLQINAFFKLDFAQFTSDPRCVFDTKTRRWFVTIFQIDIDPNTGKVTNHSHGLIAVSSTASPLSTFNVFAIDTTDDGTNGIQSHPGCPCFGDQPLIGADRNGFFYSTNEFSITALTGSGPVFSNGAQIYAMSKEEVVGGQSPTVVHFGDIPLTPGHLARSIQPAMSALTGAGDETDADRGVEYFVSHLNFNHTLDNRLAVWAISDTRTLKNANPQVELTNTIINSEVYGEPPLGDSSGRCESFRGLAGSTTARRRTRHWRHAHAASVFRGRLAVDGRHNHRSAGE